MDKTRDFAQQRFFKVFRNDKTLGYREDIDPEQSFQMRFAMHFARMCELEEPVVFPWEKIAFTRTNRCLTPAYSDADIAQEFDVHNKCYSVINNVCPNYHILISKGLSGLENEIYDLMDGANAKESDFLNACLLTIHAMGRLAARYADEAARVGNQFVESLFRRVPMQPAESFVEALQSIRFVSAMFYLAGNYQLGFGRMDQILIELYQKDIMKGELTRETAKALVSEFFVSLNRDSDLYFGVQQGDNGQSMMLGGIKRDGSSAVNELTYLFMEVSKELRLIDPKINLRIDSQTPKDLLLLGCGLTRVGLGFPQYSNDEVVIPALVKAGYSLEDARDYTVAACWEFIIPGRGLDIVNQGAVSFPAAVNEALYKADLATVTEEQMDALVRAQIFEQVKDILEMRDLQLLPSPLVSLFFEDALRCRKDVTQSARYRNRGIHGAGSANGADALYIVKRYIREGKREDLSRLVSAAQQNFDGFEDLLQYVRNEVPKIGDADPEVDGELRKLFAWFADACERYSTKVCHIRAGSGSAQFYIFLTDFNNKYVVVPKVGATIDGRKAGEPLPSSLAPASGVKINGLLSVLKSFSVIDYSRVMNGGPITVEFSPGALKTEEGLEKLVDVIRYFVKLGDQQLQLNILDEKVLEDAMKHPERHRNLIVRVWGWSGYFCELAPEFQRQIINRHKYAL